MRQLLLLLPFAAGCLVQNPAEDLLDSSLPDAEKLATTWSEARPEPRLALVWNLEDWLPGNENCPTHTIGEPDDGLEQWRGECELPDGTRILGLLERYDGTDSAWVAGDHFQVTDPLGDLVFFLDGAVEATPLGDMLLVEAAMTICGGPGAECLAGDTSDGLTAIDLASTLYPSTGYPDRYDLTISGVVAIPGREPASVYGAWSVDRSICAAEPASGSVVLADDRSSFLDFDGAAGCDGCALRTVDGTPTGLACADWIP